MRGGARDVQTTVRITLREVKEGAARTVRVPERRRWIAHGARERRAGARRGGEPAPRRGGRQRLRVPGEGTRARGPDGRERAGSLYINVDVAEDPRFARVGNDLVTRVELGVTAAALGGVAAGAHAGREGGGEGAEGHAERRPAASAWAGPAELVRAARATCSSSSAWSRPAPVAAANGAPCASSPRRRSGRKPRMRGWSRRRVVTFARRQGGGEGRNQGQGASRERVMSIPAFEYQHSVDVKPLVRRA